MLVPLSPTIFNEISLSAYVSESGPITSILSVGNELNSTVAIFSI